MAKRLSELYAIGTEVELRLPDAGWSAGRVVAHDFPGIWVATGEGRRWFVTNHRRIRSVRHAGTAGGPSQAGGSGPSAGGANE